jgi:hypothetical protein
MKKDKNSKATLERGFIDRILLFYKQKQRRKIWQKKLVKGITLDTSVFWRARRNLTLSGRLQRNPNISALTVDELRTQKKISATPCL